MRTVVLNKACVVGGIQYPKGAIIQGVVPDELVRRVMKGKEKKEKDVRQSPKQ